MTIGLNSLWQAFASARRPALSVTSPAVETAQAEIQAVDIPPDDPLLGYLKTTPGAIQVDRLHIDSPTLRALQAAGVKMAVPLVSQGELIGFLNLGPRRSDQEYSTDDTGLLNHLAMQVAPAVRVAQLVRQRQNEAQELERVEQELRVARLIQQTLLPRQVPEIPGWELAVHYQPARAVGGDFYDFFLRPDGRIVIVVGDVTDKGVPAALVMATMRAILRGAMRRLLTPGAALERSNDLLVPETPPNMFVTCLYAILDPATGRMQYANAGHDLPIRRSTGQAVEFLATGMPLGLMPGMKYDDVEGYIAPGETLLLYSDGLVEAHNPAREMFGFPRLRRLMEPQDDGAPLIPFLLGELARFTGPRWEQEDDVTLVTLARCEQGDAGAASDAPANQVPDCAPAKGREWQLLAECSVKSEPGNEQQAMHAVAEAIRDLDLCQARLDNLKTAVAEAAMNAMEHGNQYRQEAPVSIRIYVSTEAIAVCITDCGGGRPIPAPQPPDLQAKLAGEQSPRGWGLYLIQSLVDELHVTGDDKHHTIELVMRLREKTDAIS